MKLLLLNRAKCDLHFCQSFIIILVYVVFDGVPNVNYAEYAPNCKAIYTLSDILKKR